MKRGRQRRDPREVEKKATGQTKAGERATRQDGGDGRGGAFDPSRAGRLPDRVIQPGGQW